MKLKTLLFCGGMLAVTSAQALEVTTRTLPVPASTAIAADGSTIVYLYNATDQGYMLGANDWGTAASVDQNKGYKFKIAKVEDTSYYTLEDSAETKKAWKYLWTSAPETVYVDYNNQGENTYKQWVLEATTGNNFKITHGEYEGKYLAKIANSTKLNLVEGAASEWYCVTPEAYATHVAAMPLYQAAQTYLALLESAEKEGMDVSSYVSTYNDANATVEDFTKATETFTAAYTEYKSKQGSVENPADMSNLIVNGTFDTIGDFTGWSGSSFDAGGTRSTCAERFGMNYDTWQEISGLPTGVYELTVQGYYRAGTTAESYTAYQNGTSKNAYLYGVNVLEADNDSVNTNVINIFDAENLTATDVTTGSTGNVTDADGNVLYVPNTMAAATDYFDKGYYTGNKVIFPVTGGKAKIGVKKSTLISNDWSIFDNFKLKYYGAGADAYQALMTNYASGLDEYDPDQTFVTTSVLEAYNEATAKKEATTYEEYKANATAIATAKEAVEANIAAWEAYNAQYDKATAMMTGGEYAGDDYETLTEYMEGEALEIRETKELTTEQLTTETAKLEELYTNALQNNTPVGTEIELKNPNFADGETGWTFTYETKGNIRANASAKCAEAWNTGNFDIYQTVEGAPVGAYKISVQGFYRYGNNENNYFANFDKSGEYLDANLRPASKAWVYLNNSKTALKNVCDFRADADYYSSGNSYQSPTDSYKFPNDMTTGGIAFADGQYQISTSGVVAKKGDSMRVGMKGNTTDFNDSWAIFTNFKLVYMGKDVEILTSEINSNIAAIDLTKSMGSDVKAKAQGYVDAGNAAVTAADGDKIFDALVDILNYNDSIEQSQELFATLTAKAQAINDGLAAGTYPCSDPTKAEAAEKVGTITSAIEAGSYTDAQANAAIAELVELTSKLGLPEGYEDASDTNPVDVTTLMQTPSFEKDGTNSIEGWEGATGYNFGNDASQKSALALEYYEKAFDMYQDITVPNGTYMVRVSAFNRVAGLTDDYNAYAAGTDAITELYAVAGETEVKTPVDHLASDVNASSQSYGVGSESSYNNNDGATLYVPSDMLSAVAYFDNQKYKSTVIIKVTDGKLRVGIRQASSVSSRWAIMDNFKLYYFGSESQKAEEGYNEIKGVEDAKVAAVVAIYSIDGVKQTSLQKGLNIIQTADGAKKTVLVK